MGVTRAVWTLGRIDSKGVTRDPMLRWLLVLPMLVAGFARWAVPAIASQVAARFDFDLVPYYPLIASFLLLFMPGIVGAVIGFLLIDERDDGTLAALQVTPLPAGGYLAYRIAIPMLISMGATLLIVPVSGLARLDAAELVTATILAAPLAPVYALFLASFAENKVQGFALSKALGIAFWPPVIAYFVSDWWQVLFGLVPTYWPMKYFWMAHAGEEGTGAIAAAGFAYTVLLLVLLARHFNRVTRR